jgi:hypothetical protein
VRACLLQVLLAYPNAVGCASVSAVKQETEAVLQVQPEIGCDHANGKHACVVSIECALQHATTAAAACSCSLGVPQLPRALHLEYSATLAHVCPQVLLNLAAAPSSCQAVRDAGIAMVLQSLIHSVAAALSSRSGRRSPRSQREVR